MWLHGATGEGEERGGAKEGRVREGERRRGAREGGRETRGSSEGENKEGNRRGRDKGLRAYSDECGCEKSESGECGRKCERME